MLRHCRGQVGPGRADMDQATLKSASKEEEHAGGPRRLRGKTAGRAAQGHGAGRGGREDTRVHTRGGKFWTAYAARGVSPAGSSSVRGEDGSRPAGTPPGRARFAACVASSRRKRVRKVASRNSPRPLLSQRAAAGAAGAAARVQAPFQDGDGLRSARRSTSPSPSTSRGMKCAEAALSSRVIHVRPPRLSSRRTALRGAVPCTPGRPRPSGTRRSVV
jgi:hypothetical protein